MDMHLDISDKSSLSSGLLRWVAESKMLQLKDEHIIAILIQSGVGEQLAVRQVNTINSDPCFQAGDLMAQKLRKLESLVRIYEELSSLSPHSREVERISNLSKDEFIQYFYAMNRPVILTDIMRTWKAMSVWNPDYLKETCGDEIVQIMHGRENDERYEVNIDNHRRMVSFRDYVEMVTSASETNDFYLVANNHFMETEGGKRLYNDIQVFAEYLDSDNLGGQVFFWFGPAGTITPLHHDTMNVFLAQVFGRKRVTLISPNQTPFLYNDIGVYSEVDCGNPDYEAHPLYRNVRKIELILEPGEVLFLPVGWWHYVKALDVSISVSFTNFIVPNSYTWFHPNIIEPAALM